jgi:hypothetical protein
MAEAGYNESSVVLPSMFGDPGSAMENALNRKQQDKRFEYQKQKEKEMDDWRKYQVLRDTVNPEDVAVGNATFDEWSGSETKKVMQEIMKDPAMAKGSFVDLYAAIQNKWLPVVNAANKMKAGIAQIDANVKASGTEDTNLATDQLAADAKLRMIQDTMPIGQDGKRIYNTGNYNPDKNYVQDILGSEDSWRYVKGPEPLIKYIENHKTEDVNLQKNLPDQSIVPYKGKQSAFAELNIIPNEMGVIKNSDIPEFKIASEEDFVTEDDGTQVPVKLLRKDKYEQHFENIPANKKVLNALWNRHKEMNGIKSKNATEEEKRKRAFALGVVQAHDPSQMSRQTSQHLPRNTTNNFINTGGANPDALINKVYERINSKIDYDLGRGFNRTRYNALANDEQEVIKKAVENAGYEVGEGGSNVFLRKDSVGQLKVYRVADNGELLVKPEYEITTLSYEGTNVPKQVNVKSKIEAVQKGKTGEAVTLPPKPNQQSRPKTVKQNGITYTWNEKTQSYE